MLRELRIENLLLIERAELRFGPGLNAITGETGAGKTILAHSIDLLSGGNARDGIVRPGASEAYVEGAFAMPQGFFEDGGDELAEIAARIPESADGLVLARRVSAAGRTSAFVAGRSASARDLRLLAGRLLGFYGQHEHRRLTLASAQMEILDGFGGAQQIALRSRYRQAQLRVGAIERELAELREREGARERDLDLMRFEFSEIEAAAPEQEEVEGLETERSRLQAVEFLREAASRGAVALAGGGDAAVEEGGARAALDEADAALRGGADRDAELATIAGRVAALAIEAGEAARDLRGYLDRLEADPGRLMVVEERLDVIDRLKRKHGGSVESVLAYGERCREQIERLVGTEERSLGLESELSATTPDRDRIGVELSAARAAAARRLETAVGAELGKLAMDGARLEVELNDNPAGWGPNGRESVELRVATNPGMPLAPLRDAASGGELSRLMLALCSLGGGGTRTFVFDEIDAGIGGTTATAVGERLRALGRDGQVICITHLAQVAAQADRNFTIAKRADAGGARTTVDRVEGEALVAEITRMLGAAAGDAAAGAHARDLLAAG